MRHVLVCSISNLKYNLLDTGELTNNFIKLQTTEIKNIGGATTDFVSNVLNQPQQPALAMQKPTSTLQQPASTLQQPASTTQQPASTSQQPVSTLQQPALAMQKEISTPQQPSLTYPQNIIEDAIDDILFIYSLLSNNDNMAKINAIINNR